MVKLSWPRPKHSSPLPSPHQKRTLSSSPPMSSPEAYMALTQELSDAMRACATSSYSASSSYISAARSLHSRLISLGLASSTFLQNNLLQAYLSCGSLEDARRVFEGIAAPNVISHNMMINGCFKFALLDDAVKVFDEMPVRDTTSWNTLVSGYFQTGRFSEAVKAFVCMNSSADCGPNMFTLTCTMKACGALRCHRLGLQLHGFVEKFDFGRDVQVQGALIDMYVKCGAIEFASKLFDQLESPNLFCWNSMLLGFSRFYGVGRAIELFDRMPARDIVSWNMMI